MRGNVMFVDYGDNPLSYNTSNIDNVNRALWNVIALQPLTAANVSDSLILRSTRSHSE